VIQTTSRTIFLVAVVWMMHTPARAQHADDNAVAAASDVFGLTIGTEALGIYNPDQVRGFNPQSAGNARIGGLYFDQQQGSLSERVVDGSSIKVGISSLGYSFPAPTGIVDFELRHCQETAQVTTIAYAGPFQTRGADLDAQLPVMPQKLCVPLGVSSHIDASFSGLTSHSLSFGAVPVYNPTPRITIRMLFDWQRITRSRSMPVVFPTSGYIPAPIVPSYYGQTWAQDEFEYRTVGTLLQASLSEHWSLAAGLFRSRYANPTGYSEYYLNVAPGGQGDHEIIGYTGQNDTTISGEARLRGDISLGRWRHELAISLRGRSSSAAYGGADIVDLDTASIYRPVQRPAPNLLYQALTFDHTHLRTAGLAYQLQWSSRANLTLGVSRTDYGKQVTTGMAPRFVTRADPLRAYVNATFALTGQLDLYSSHTQGFEDSGIAPGNTVNRGAILPASLTSQSDAGLRYRPAEDLTLLVGAFEVRKPYFNTSIDDRYIQLGRQRHRGLEFSLTTSPADGLNIIAGGVLLHPEVSADPLLAGPSGSSAVGQTHRLLQISLNYRLPALEALQLDTVLTQYGWASADVANTVRVPGYLKVDLGARYKFTLSGATTSLRVQLLNIANTFGWLVADGGGLTPLSPRTLQSYLTVDF